MKSQLNKIMCRCLKYEFTNLYVPIWAYFSLIHVKVEPGFIRNVGFPILLH